MIRQKYNPLGGIAAAAATAAVLLGLGSAAASAERSHAAPAPAATPTDTFVARRLSRNPVSGWSSVVIALRPDPGAAVGARSLSASEEASVRSLGGYVYRRLPLIGGAAVRVPSRNLSRLASLPWVGRLSSDEVPVKKTDEFTVASSGADTAFGQYSLTGSGVAVAVLDSGVDPAAPDLQSTVNNQSRVVASVNFVGDTNSSADPCGHGTHVGGIIAGNGKASSSSNCYRTFYGIARRARLVDVRVLDSQGQGTVSNVIKGIDWVISNRKAYNIRVINLSLGHEVGESYKTDPLCLAVEKAWKAGIVVVCSAGNQGRLQSSADASLGNGGYGTRYGSIQSPGNSPYAITVGAMKSTGGGRAFDQIATYSSRGPTRLDFVLKPDLVAPGNRVISLAPGSGYLQATYGATNTVKASEYAIGGSTKDSTRYFRLSGTSMAAPVVSGAVALLLQADPSLSPDTVKARLMATADKWAGPDGQFDACTFGAGYLNIPAALRSTLVATRPALSPALVRDANTGTVFVDTQQIIWGESGVWGTGIAGPAGVWGTQIIWGEGALRNSQIIWGDSVWSDQIIWGESRNSVDLSAKVIRGED
jgi:serine protease AprX